MDIKSEIIGMAKNAKAAATILSRTSSTVKNQALLDMAEELRKQKDVLIEENRKDLAYARTLGLSAAMLDRLTLKEATIEGIAGGLAGSGRPARSGG